MIDATISRVRLRGLAGLGRFQASPRPGTDDLVAATI
jgi:hypothetical protein